MSNAGLKLLSTTCHQAALPNLPNLPVPGPNCQFPCLNSQEATSKDGCFNLETFGFLNKLLNNLLLDNVEKHLFKYFKSTSFFIKTLWIPKPMFPQLNKKNKDLPNTPPQFGSLPTQVGLHKAIGHFRHSSCSVPSGSHQHPVSLPSAYVDHRSLGKEKFKTLSILESRSLWGSLFLATGILDLSFDS